MNISVHSSPSSIKGLTIPFSGKKLSLKNTPIGIAETRIRSEIDSVLSVQESRELVAGNDNDFLKKLEQKYIRFKDLNNLAICSEISIFEEYIVVAGLKIDRFNISPGVDNTPGLYKIPKLRFTFLDYNALNQFCDNSRRLLTEKDVEYLLNNMPGNNFSENFFNFRRILNFYLGGNFSANFNNFIGNGIYGKYWLQVNKGRTTGEYLYVSKKGISINNSCTFDDGCLVRFAHK